MARRRLAVLTLLSAVAATSSLWAQPRTVRVATATSAPVVTALVAREEQPAPAEEQAATPPGPVLGASRSHSVGSTKRGRLLRGTRLDATPHVRIRNPSQAYGTAELVALIAWAAERVAEEHEGAVLSVGDLSRERGGRLRPHRSHRVGRDADLGFYLRDGTTGEPVESRHFVALPRGAKGTDRSGATFAFDEARNWSLIAALVGQDVVPIQYIMVISPLKVRLLAEGRRRGASEELLARVDAVVGPQRTGSRIGTHDSHFHVRIYCSGDDVPRCIDQPPFHPWVTRSAPRARPRAPRAPVADVRRDRHVTPLVVAAPLTVETTTW
ncbi:MAG: penicillin-insensitive murein endopeptidase [Sandaracinus sp.]|nr:penicillin-insensitive murein endopeptidase [Sandaracinus sp.]